jgi:hypothetical protein
VLVDTISFLVPSLTFISTTATRPRSTQVPWSSASGCRFSASSRVSATVSLSAGSSDVSPVDGSLHFPV